MYSLIYGFLSTVPKTGGLTVMCIVTCMTGSIYLLGTKFTGLGECHTCAVRTLQEVAVGGLVALDWRGPVVVGVLGVPRVRPPLQLVP